MEECEMNQKTINKEIFKKNLLTNSLHSGKNLPEFNGKESPPSKSKVSTRISHSVMGSKGGKDLSEIVRIIFKKKSDLDESNDISQLFGNFHVKINLFIKEEDNISKNFSFNLNVSENLTINKLIEYSVKKFNEIFEKKSMPFKLKKEFSLYSMKPSKKNGEPKYDMPCKILFFNLILGFDGEADLCDCNTNQFCLVFKINSSCFDYKFGEKERKENFKCVNCLVI